jgi:hypothetical protein
MPPVSKDTIVAILMFVSGILSLLLTQAFVPATLVPWLNFAIGVIGLALSIFFGVVKPITQAFLAGRSAALAEKSAK